MEPKQSSGEVFVGSGDRRRECRHLPVPCVAPWLVIPYDEKGMEKQAFYNPCELLGTSRSCQHFIPELNGKVFCQKPSHGGWLVILCSDNQNASPPNSKFGDCFLWNPVTLQIILLPSLLHWITSKYRIVDCTLSSPPSDANSTVLYLFKSDQGSDDDPLEYVIVYCTPGDQEWRKKQLSNDSLYDPSGFHSLTAVKGKVYAFYLNEWHLEIEKHQDHSLIIRQFHVEKETLIPNIVRGGGVGTSYIHYVESHDEVFRVQMKFSGNAKVITSLQITRLNFSSMAWDNVENLCDHVLFIGNNTTASCSAVKMGLKRGCLFYVLPEDKSLYILDVQDNCTKLILPFLKLASTPRFSLEWLMIPTTDEIKNNRPEEIQEDQRLSKRELVACSDTSYELSGIFDVIANSLHPVDYIHFRSVCKEAQSKIPATSWRFSSVRTKAATHLSPWLVFLTDNGTVFNFVNPMHNNERYFVNCRSALLTGATIRYSKGGWLLMSKGKNVIFFYNPFTREIIRLPELPGEETCRFHGISFSSLPTFRDCIVFAVSDWFNSGVRIFTIKRGNNSWTILEIPALPSEPRFMPCFNNPIFCGVSFLCLGCGGDLGYLVLDELRWGVFTELIKQIGDADAYTSFLVPCGENVLSVYLGQPFGKSVDIYKLDTSKKKWVEVESLDKYMIFISNTSSFSARAPPNSHMANKIYFPRLHGEGILFYSLDTRMYQTTGGECTYDNFCGSYEYMNTSWIQPNWSLSTDQELDWFALDGVQASGTVFGDIKSGKAILFMGKADFRVQ